MNESPEQATQLTWEILLNQTEAFSQKLEAALEALGITSACEDLAIDHICVRLQNSSDVSALKTQLTKVGEIISAVQVNGREISIIQLNEPLHIGNWQIPAVELPYPKPKHTYEDGWEHVEFVLPATTNTMPGVRDAFFTRFPHLEKAELMAHFNYSEDEPIAEDDQLPNPTISLKVAGVGLKFHAEPIQKVVGYLK